MSAVRSLAMLRVSHSCREGNELFLDVVSLASQWGNSPGGSSCSSSLEHPMSVSPIARRLLFGQLVLAEWCFELGPLFSGLEWV
jgi:hypothetical protein